MALDAGTIFVTLEFAKDLEDKDWFGKQDPYCVLTFGNQKVKSKTHVDGGKNPVWNETFQFQAINDNTISIQIYDEDIGKDDFIGSCTISCAKAREQGHDRIQAPVQTKKGKQKGIISVGMRFEANKNIQKPEHQPSQNIPLQSPSGAYPYPPQGYAPPPYGYAPPPGYMPAPYPYPPPGYGHPPPPYGAPPPYYQYPPPGPHGQHRPPGPPGQHPPPAGQHPPPAGQHRPPPGQPGQQAPPPGQHGPPPGQYGPSPSGHPYSAPSQNYQPPPK